MVDTTQESEAIMREAGRSLTAQRAGGHHRQAGRQSIGRGSAEFKAGHFARKIKRILIACAVIFTGAMATGLIINGLGFAGIMITLFLLAVTIAFLSTYPKLKIPKRAELNRGDVKTLVSRTEIWLEHQRPALPAPAVRIVNDIGVQLDALGMQLEHVDQAHPAAAQARKLVGEYLPEMIESYRRIPAHLRREERVGATPDQQLEESLRKISDEIDHVTRQLADGALDELAVRSRYLDYKFGGQIEGPRADSAAVAGERR